MKLAITTLSSNVSKLFVGSDNKVKSKLHLRKNPSVVLPIYLAVAADFMLNFQDKKLSS